MNCGAEDVASRGLVLHPKNYPLPEWVEVAFILAGGYVDSGLIPKIVSLHKN